MTPPVTPSDLSVTLYDLPVTPCDLPVTHSDLPVNSSDLPVTSTMSDPRLTSHQQYDIIRCKQCNRIYERPLLLACLHSFCTVCLQELALTAPPSSDTLACPTCQEETTLTNSVDGLRENTILTRFIDQAQRDKTMLVAGREVLEMQKQALTEEELLHPDVINSIQEIADTAGHVIANGLVDQGKVHDFESVRLRQDLQARTGQLQQQAIHIVHSIDKVNQDVDDWTEVKHDVRDKIRQRSAKIQDAIRGIERRLITQLENRDLEMKMKNEAFAVKGKLHKKLKSCLTLVDFIKLLSEFGNKTDLESFTDTVENREQELMTQQVTITKNLHSFDPPCVDIQEGLELMFGTMAEITEETSAWDPKMADKQQMISSDTSPSSDVESHLGGNLREEAKLSQLAADYTEINEHGNPVEHNGPNEFGTRFSKRFEHEEPQKQRRRPLKSMSFDAGMPYHLYRQQKTGSDSRVADGDQTSTNYQVLDEAADAKTDTNDQDESPTKENETVHKHAVNSAMQSLAGSSDTVQYPINRMWSRRVSAPSTMIIDTLTRRRLHALSILERSNINTAGLNVTSDVESGLNQARLEWLRENVRRKMSADHKSSIDEGV